MNFFIASKTVHMFEGEEKWDENFEIVSPKAAVASDFVLSLLPSAFIMISNAASSSGGKLILVVVGSYVGGGELEKRRSPNKYVNLCMK